MTWALFRGRARKATLKRAPRPTLPRMSERWQENFGFYMTTLDEAPASFVVDLNAEPQTSHPLRLQLRVPLLKPRPDGLRDASELEPMGALEDRLAEALKAKTDAIYVGRLVSKGATEFFFYLPDAAKPQLDDLEALLGPCAPYTVEYLAAEDPEWNIDRKSVV
jgi:hypothetical protein